MNKFPVSVGHFCGKHAMANRYGAPKNKNEQISVVSFLWEARYGSKKNGNVPFFSCRSVFFFVATYGTVATSEDQMFPRWASFSNFKLAGHIQKK